MFVHAPVSVLIAYIRIYFNYIYREMIIAYVYVYERTYVCGRTYVYMSACVRLYDSSRMSVLPNESFYAVMWRLMHWMFQVLFVLFLPDFLNISLLTVLKNGCFISLPKSQNIEYVLD